MARGMPTDNLVDLAINLHLNLLDLHRQALLSEDPLLRLSTLAVFGVLLFVCLTPPPEGPMLRRLVTVTWLIVTGLAATWYVQPFQPAWGVPTAWAALIAIEYTARLISAQRALRRQAEPKAA